MNWLEVLTNNQGAKFSSLTGSCSYLREAKEDVDKTKMIESYKAPSVVQTKIFAKVIPFFDFSY